MPEKISNISLIRSLGLRYVLQRGMHILALKSGSVKRKNPSGLPECPPINRQIWEQQRGAFFYATGGPAYFPMGKADTVTTRAERIIAGVYPFFHALEYSIPRDVLFLTDPQSDTLYDNSRHWTHFSDMPEGKDIKYIWELSRFSYLLQVMRADKYTGTDHGAFAIQEILNWIEQNPFNLGPQYMSGQEIALRLLNWNFILYYYGDHPALDDDSLQKICSSLHAQLVHIEKNMRFTKRFVRNNHLITEAAALFVCGTLYPFLPDAEKLQAKGKRMLEEEAAWQIFPDGTYLQHSMNYHRVIVQVYTYVLRLAEIHNISFAPVVRERLQKSLDFLFTCIQPETGLLPNTGNNDGTLFFPLNDEPFTDHRPALQALAFLLHANPAFDTLYEDLYWYGIRPQGERMIRKEGAVSFTEGGYITYREGDTFTYVRCSNNLPRPGQADNLHLEIFVQGKPLLLDGGTYSYKMHAVYGNYFFGSASHNTILIEHADQMQKGPRFIWLNRSKIIRAEVIETEKQVVIQAAISAFTHIRKNISHQRTIEKTKGETVWRITDRIYHADALEKQQNWLLAEGFDEQAEIQAADANGTQLHPLKREGYFSESYGMVKNAERRIFTTKTEQIQTIIRLKQ